MNIAIDRDAITGLDRLDSPSTPILPTGYDPGFGQTKLAVSGCREVVIPAYYHPCLITKDHNIPASVGGAYVQYIQGDRDEHLPDAWLTGKPAYLMNPTRYTKLADDRAGKHRLSLELLLGALATLPYREHWNLLVVPSIHDVETFGDALKQRLQGSHLVRFGSNPEPSRITIDVPKVYEEGFGVCASRMLETRQQLQRLVFDIGSGTIRVVAFGPSGNVLNEPETIKQGVDALIDAIAKHPDVRAFEEGEEGDRHLIRQGIEQHTLTYGTTGFSFADVYHAELGQWAKSVLLKAIKYARPYQKMADEVIAVGGGADLPSLQDTLTGCGIVPATESALLNVRGLKGLAHALLTQRDGGVA
ncbi:MAG: hypothetical protein F6K30_19295 [Cyanothece sp. SIO2G6]|nr:hypothetical protein [Cyanothece sp. SIO2G6]